MDAAPVLSVRLEGVAGLRGGRTRQDCRGGQRSSWRARARGRWSAGAVGDLFAARAQGRLDSGSLSQLAGGAEPGGARFGADAALRLSATAALLFLRGRA